jgi:ribosomal protein L40E
MIVCPHCQHLNPEAATHCQACGQALSNPLYRACGSCGALNALERTHCSHCLSPLIDPLAVGGPPEENPSIPEDNLWAADPLAEIAPRLPLWGLRGTSLRKGKRPCLHGRCASSCGWASF